MAGKPPVTQAKRPPAPPPWVGTYDSGGKLVPPDGHWHRRGALMAKHPTHAHMDTFACTEPGCPKLLGGP